MSLSDCPKCWNNPCECGYWWRNSPKEYLRKMIRGLQLELATPGGWYADSQLPVAAKVEQEPSIYARLPYVELRPGDVDMDMAMMDKWFPAIEAAGFREDLGFQEKLEVAYANENNQRRPAWDMEQSQIEMRLLQKAGSA